MERSKREQWRQGKISITIKCLKCGKEFTSFGANNRFCKVCQQKNKEISELLWNLYRVGGDIQ